MLESELESLGTFFVLCNPIPSGVIPSHRSEVRACSIAVVQGTLLKDNFQAQLLEPRSQPNERFGEVINSLMHGHVITESM